MPSLFIGYVGSELSNVNCKCKKEVVYFKAAYKCGIFLEKLKRTMTFLRQCSYFPLPPVYHKTRAWTARWVRVSGCRQTPADWSGTRVKWKATSSSSRG